VPRIFPVEIEVKQLKRSWIPTILVGCLATGVSDAPMLIKKLAPSRIPLAPHFGCQNTFWAVVYGLPRQNISVVDLLLYPLVWTFAYRADMLGNILLLFIGSFT
jgi:hypothetical protein